MATPTVFWCSRCKERHAGECPPTTVIVSEDEPGHPAIGDRYIALSSGEIGTVKLLVPETRTVRVEVENPRPSFGNWQAWNIQGTRGVFERLR